MKAETRLKKIMAMDDSPTKQTKLFLFCCNVLPQCELWKVAHAEWGRLFDKFKNEGIEAK